MSEIEAGLGLLPAGFIDLMPEEAEKEAQAINTLMDLFTGFGYQRIKPPLIEFEASLLAPGPGASLAKDTFRMMDPISHRMLGVRADITPQIARIVCSRLPKQIKPMRLTYANDVVRSQSGQLRNSRQFCQVGCEIIRDDRADCYIELALLAVKGLKGLGISALTLDFTIPRLLDTVLSEAGLNENIESKVRESLAKRDRDGIRLLELKEESLFLALMDQSGEARAALSKAKSLSLPPAIQDEIEKLSDIVENLYTALDEMKINDVSLTFDPFEIKGFEYHSGIAFTLFARGVRGELGRGGFYHVSFGTVKDGDDAEKAIGFTLYMDTIRPAVNLETVRKYLAVPSATKWAEIEKYRNEGWSILRFVEEADIPDMCRFILKNNSVQER
jgi:ATP phosphoribosyltransferase regulatory subunit